MYLYLEHLSMGFWQDNHGFVSPEGGTLESDRIIHPWVSAELTWVSDRITHPCISVFCEIEGGILESDRITHPWVNFHCLSSWQQPDMNKNSKFGEEVRVRGVYIVVWFLSWEGIVTQIITCIIILWIVLQKWDIILQGNL